jgi:hypothetical protein
VISYLDVCLKREILRGVTESSTDDRKESHAAYMRDWRRRRREKRTLIAEVEAELADHPKGDELVGKIRRIAES